MSAVTVLLLMFLQLKSNIFAFPSRKMTGWSFLNVVSVSFLSYFHLTLVRHSHSIRDALLLFAFLVP